MIFFPLSLFFPLCLYFSPCVFIFSLLGHAINCSTFAGGVLGENILCLCFSPWPCCMVFILPFFLDSFSDMSLRRNNIIFSPLVQFFFLLVTEKIVKKLMGERKMVFFPISIYFPHRPCCIWFPFSDSYRTEVHENDIYPWLKCTFFCL